MTSLAKSVTLLFIAGTSVLVAGALWASTGAGEPSVFRPASTGDQPVEADWRAAVDAERWAEPPPSGSSTVPDFGGRAATQPGEPSLVAEPVHVRVPGVEIAVDLDPLGLTDEGELEVPEQFDRGGWYAGGPLPGEPGPAVITAHVDSYDGPAPFYRLREVAVGDQVEVVTAAGVPVTFTVTRVAEYDKDEFPTLAVYGNTSGPELRLITCGGSFDRSARSYESNVIVWAELDPGSDAT